MHQCESESFLVGLICWLFLSGNIATGVLAIPFVCFHLWLASETYFSYLPLVAEHMPPPPFVPLSHPWVFSHPVAAIFLFVSQRFHVVTWYVSYCSICSNVLSSSVFSNCCDLLGLPFPPLWLWDQCRKTLTVL